MAELADAADSKSADRKVVGVRPPLPAPIKSMIYEINASSDAFFYAQTMTKARNAVDGMSGFLPMRFKWSLAMPDFDFRDKLDALKQGERLHLDLPSFEVICRAARAPNCCRVLQS